VTTRRPRPHLTEDQHDVLRRALRQLGNAPRPTRPNHLGAALYAAFAENA
jgi:hypothetical protein